MVCLSSIFRRANLMLALTDGTALAVPGRSEDSILKPDELEKHRATMLTAFLTRGCTPMCAGNTAGPLIV